MLCEDKSLVKIYSENIGIDFKKFELDFIIYYLHSVMIINI